jgi:actin-related protein
MQANITEVSCKDRRFYSSQRLINSGHRWSEYKICEDEHNLYLLDLLDDSSKKAYLDESSKIYNVIKGYNVHKDRLIKNYEELDYEKKCKDYVDWDR